MFATGADKYVSRLRTLIRGAVYVVMTYSNAAAWAGDAEEVRALRAKLEATEMEIRSLKTSLEKFEKKSASLAQKREFRRKRLPSTVENTVKAANVETLRSSYSASPAILINLTRGLQIETVDKANMFRIGGRVFLDGGGSTQPEQGQSSTANIRSARIETEGKIEKFWNYKLQYEFTAGNTKNVGAIGGIRDAYLAFTYFDPIHLQIGHFFEPMGLEWTNTKNATTFMERAMFFTGPLHHLGAALLAHGSNWSLKGGLFSTSLLEKSLQPTASTPVPWWVSPQAGWVPIGGSQYIDIASRATYAPILNEDSLLHLGVSERYHRPNDSTAVNDGALAPGSGIKTEANVLNENLLGTPDLSCGAVSFNGNPPTAGRCVRNAVLVGTEFAVARGPLSFQGEYLAARYTRDPDMILRARTIGNYAPGGATLEFRGYYVFGSLFLTGESRAASYQLSGLNPATFGPIKIKNSVSSGGYGALELGLRFQRDQSQ